MLDAKLGEFSFDVENMFTFIHPLRWLSSNLMRSSFFLFHHEQKDTKIENKKHRHAIETRKLDEDHTHRATQSISSFIFTLLGVEKAVNRRNDRRGE